MDCAGRIRLTNRPFPGVSPEEITGRLLREFVPESLRDRLQRSIEEVVKTGEPLQRETRLTDQAPDGGDAWWLTRFVPLRGETDVVGVLLIASDITAHMRAEQRLRESEERLSLAVAATRDGVWDWDVSSGQAVYSDDWSAMLGYEPNEIAPNVDAWRMLVHPDDLPQAELALREHFRGSTSHYDVELRMRTREGGWKWVRARGRVVSRDAERRPLRVAGTHQDVDAARRESTERERLIHELTAALAQVKTLSGLLPICGSCKKIRDDRGYWQQIEAFVSKHSEAQFSHGLCPICADRLREQLEARYPGVEAEDGGGEG